MATEDLTIATRRGAGTPARVRCAKLATIVIAGHAAAVKSPITIPAGSYLRAITLDTPTAISGSPSSVNFRAGTTDTGQEIVADVDAKGQGHIACTIVAALDKVGAFSAADTTLYLQATAAGGTAEAGTIYALVDYDAPNY